MSTLFMMNLQDQLEMASRRAGEVVPVPEVPMLRFIQNVVQIHYDNPSIPDVTYAQVRTLWLQLAHFLEEHRLVWKGVCASICLPNSYHFAIYFLGVASVGGATTGFSDRGNPAEWIYQLNDSQAVTLLTSEDVYNRLMPILDQIPHLKNVILVDVPTNSLPKHKRLRLFSWESVTKSEPEFDITKVQFDSKNDLLVLPYSSGTTGKPKGVMITHFNYVAQVISFKRFSETRVYDHLKRFGLDPEKQSNALLFSPFHHAMGFFLLCAHLVRGNTVVVYARMELERYLQGIQQFKTPLLDQYDLSSVINFGCGGSSLTPQASRAFCQRLPQCKLISEGYGMTELTCAIASSCSKTKPGSVGVVLPNIQYRIVNTKTGLDCAANEPGEFWVKGPVMMKGYWRRPQETAAVMSADGYLKTGDLLYEDEDGELFVVGRLKELIKVNSFQVAPAELEDLVRQCAGVADVAVVGVPHPVLGQVPRAFVVAAPGLGPAARDRLAGSVQAFVASRVSQYKKLSGGVQFVDALPRNEAGKLLRRVLLEQCETSKL